MKHFFGSTALLSLSLIVLLATGCATDEKIVRPTDTKSELQCSAGSSGDAGCAVFGAVMLFAHAAFAPGSTFRKDSKNSIFGSCVIRLIGPVSETKQACQDVAIETNDGRRIWVQGDQFEITGLKSGLYNLEASSETYKAKARLEKVRPGTAVKIELKVDVR